MHKGNYPNLPGLAAELRHAALLAIDLQERMLAGDASRLPLRRAVELADLLVLTARPGRAGPVREQLAMIDLALLRTKLRDNAEDIARALLGDPTEGTAREVRHGRRARSRSRSAATTPARYQDFEHGDGGSLLT